MIDMTQIQNYTTFYALLNQLSLETNEIVRLKKLSKLQDEITKEVYKEYSSFRLKLLNNLNYEINYLLLLIKTIVHFGANLVLENVGQQTMIICTTKK